MTAANDKSGDYTLPLEMFVRALPHGARLIGIDVGSKTLGLALSDVTRNIASGLVTLRRSRFAADAESLLKLAAEHQIGGFVVGLPLNLDGSTGPRVAGHTRICTQPGQAHAAADLLLGRAAVHGGGGAGAAGG